MYQYLHHVVTHLILKTLYDHCQVACERVDKTAAPVRPFAMYPMTLTKYQGGVMGQCFDRGFVVLVSLRPVSIIFEVSH